MSDPSNKSVEQPQLRRRWFQFSLRTLLVVSVLFSFAAAWYGNHYLRIKRQREAIANCLSHGCHLSYTEPSKGEDIGEYGDFGVVIKTPKQAPALTDQTWEFLFGEDKGDQLKTIIIDIDQESKKSVISSLREFPNLKLIDLRGKHADSKILRQIVNDVPQLEMLSLFEGKYLPDDIKTLSNSRKLWHLNLVSRSFNDETIQHLGELENLTHLTFNVTKITSKGMEQIARLKKLEFLELADAGKIDDTGFKNLTQLTRLRKLWLQHSAITDIGLEYLGQLPQLEELRLHVCQKVDGSGFATFNNSKKLTNVFVWSMKFNDDGLQKLVHSGVPVEELSIMFGKVTDDGFKMIESLQTLKTLNLGNGNQISDETREYLQRKLPQCKINAARKKP